MSYSLLRLTSLSILLVCFLPLPQLVFAQIVDPQNVLIRNVYLLDSGEGTEGVLVNILIRDNKLEIITQDKVTIDDSMLAVDARDGYLLGQLQIGETPSFIILNQDPRENFEILLDTSFFTVFAVHNGRLFENNLLEVEEEEVADEPKRLGWTAYSPPPMALPLSYGDTSKWNRWETKYVSGIFIAGVALDRQQWLSQDSESEQQVGDLQLFEGGEIRAFRAGVVGTLNFEKPWIYTLAGATNTFDKGFETEQLDSFVFFDYRLDIPVSDKITLSVGKQKEPFSMERIMSMVQLPMQERAVVSDALNPSRNFGAVISSTALDQRMTWAGGFFNDWIESGSSFSDSASQVVGRVTWLPFISEDESNLLHLGFGMRYTDAEQGLRYSSDPEFNKSPIYVDTSVDGTPFAADSATLYNLEATWRKGPYWIAAEFMSNDVDAPALGNPNFSGYHVTASWIFSGEMREYRKQTGILGPIPVAKSVNQGGWGAWEVGVRWSDIDLADGLIDGGEMDILSLGLSWWLTPVFNVNMNYRFITLDRFGVRGDSSGLNVRVFLSLE
jgi:phosphate-selective porin OprO/OprP